MSANTAELTLIIKAQNLADVALAQIRTDMNKITTTARVVATDVALAFKDVGKRIGRQLGNLATDILSGGSITNSLVMVGATMAGAVVEGMAVHLIPGIIARVMTTQAFAPLAAAIAGEGATLGAVLATAIGVGAAALPFVILAAAVAALVYLIHNPEARQKAREVALMIIGRVGDGLRALPGFLAGVFSAALNAVLSIARRIVARIIDVILAIPRAVAGALAALGALGSKQFQVAPGRKPRQNAAGGWVGLHGPELSWVGEEGPEYIIPNHKLGDKGGPMGGKPVVIPIILDGREIGRVVDEHLYYAVQRSSPSRGRA